LEETEIEDGECLTALAVPPHNPCHNFALWGHGGNATVTWGNAADGGDRW